MKRETRDAIGAALVVLFMAWYLWAQADRAGRCPAGTVYSYRLAICVAGAEPERKP